jgi:hypothetical protein
MPEVLTRKCGCYSPTDHIDAKNKNRQQSWRYAFDHQASSVSYLSLNSSSIGWPVGSNTLGKSCQESAHILWPYYLHFNHTVTLPRGRIWFSFHVVLLYGRVFSYGRWIQSCFNPFSALTAKVADWQAYRYRYKCHCNALAASFEMRFNYNSCVSFIASTCSSCFVLVILKPG